MRTLDVRDSVQHAPQTSAVDFHGAAIIDENGLEKPITEEMIQEACQKLGELWVVPPSMTSSN